MSGMTENLVARRERVLEVGAPLFHEEPIHIVRGDGLIGAMLEKEACFSYALG